MSPDTSNMKKYQTFDYFNGVGSNSTGSFNGAGSTDYFPV